jgi:hypothetical protein
MPEVGFVGFFFRRQRMFAITAKSAQVNTVCRTASPGGT